jgi:carboxylesterase type B
VKGHAASISPTVSEYLGIRYGQPARGELRLAAPVAYKSSASFSANAYVRNLDFERVMIDADLFCL